MTALGWLCAALVVAACWCAVALLVALGWHLLRVAVKRRAPEHSLRGERP